jgi:hypothetical protein
MKGIFVLGLWIIGGFLNAQTYKIYIEEEPNPSQLSEPGSIGIQCDSLGQVCILTRSQNTLKTDTLGIFTHMKWIAKEYARYTKAPSEEAYAAAYQKRATRSAQSRIKVIFPIPTDVLNPEIDLIWRPYPETRNYFVYLTDRFNQILARKSTLDTTLKINLTEYNIQKGVCYFWFVEPEQLSDARSDEICLTWVKDEVGIFLQEEIARIERTQGMDKATRHLMRAGLYEQHKMFIEALKEYKAAVAEFPEADDLKRMYGMFLVRIGVVKTVREVWN